MSLFKLCLREIVSICTYLFLSLLLKTNAQRKENCVCKSLIQAEIPPCTRHFKMHSRIYSRELTTLNLLVSSPFKLPKASFFGIHIFPIIIKKGKTSYQIRKYSIREWNNEAAIVNLPQLLAVALGSEGSGWWKLDLPHTPLVGQLVLDGKEWWLPLVGTRGRQKVRGQG